MLRAGHLLQLVVIGMLGFAVIVVHSAGMDVSGQAGADGSAFETKYIVHAVMAVIFMWFASRINLRQAMQVRWYRNPIHWLLLISLLLVGLAMTPVGLDINGARRWLRIGAGSLTTNFQPSEMTKWLAVLFIAWWCARHHQRMAQFRWLLVLAGIIGAACAVIVIQDLGTAALIAGVAGVMIVAGGARIRHLLAFVPPVGAALFFAINQSPYRLQRLTTFLDPWQDPQGAGFQITRSIAAFADGGLTGNGFGNGVARFDHVPIAQSDMLFAIICNDMGIMGAVLVVAMFLAILWLGMSIVRDCKDLFSRLVGLGIITTICLQALINMAVVTGLAPTKGIALPLLSAGGTGWVLTAMAVGLLASFDTANEIDELSEPIDVGLRHGEVNIAAS